MTAPAGPPLSAAVEAVLDRLFPEDSRAAIAALLLRDCGATLPLASDARLIERIRLAVLKLAEGDPAAVPRHLAIARQDWRDVLVAAGFGSDLQAHLAWARGLG